MQRALASICKTLCLSIVCPNSVEEYSHDVRIHFICSIRLHCCMHTYIRIILGRRYSGIACFWYTLTRLRRQKHSTKYKWREENPHHRLFWLLNCTQKAPLNRFTATWCLYYLDPRLKYTFYTHCNHSIQHRLFVDTESLLTLSHSSSGLKSFPFLPISYIVSMVCTVQLQACDSCFTQRALQSHSVFRELHKRHV